MLFENVKGFLDKVTSKTRIGLALLRSYYETYCDMTAERSYFVGDLYLQTRVLTLFVVRLAIDGASVPRNTYPELRRNILFVLYTALTEDFACDFAEGKS